MLGLFVVLENAPRLRVKGLACAFLSLLWQGCGQVLRVKCP